MTNVVLWWRVVWFIILVALTFGQCKVVKWLWAQLGGKKKCHETGIYDNLSHNSPVKEGCPYDLFPLGYCNHRYT